MLTLNLNKMKSDPVLENAEGEKPFVMSKEQFDAMSNALDVLNQIERNLSRLVRKKSCQLSLGAGIGENRLLLNQQTELLDDLFSEIFEANRQLHAGV